MRHSSFVFLLFSFCCLVLESQASLEDVVDAKLRSAFLGPGVWPAELNDQEIQQQLTDHFETVLETLRRQADVSLDEATSRLMRHRGSTCGNERNKLHRKLKQQRTKQIHALMEYTAQGMFPRNEGHADDAVPIFVDSHGTHCAVGYLMHRSGGDEVVSQIVADNNLIFVDDIDDGAGLDWILNSGLTQSEAAMIQPAYAPPTFDALLSDFDVPGFSVSESGLTISDLAVRQYSFQPASTDLDLVFLEAIDLVDALGGDIDDPDSFGVAVGEGVHDPGKGEKILYEPNFENWVFLGRNLEPFNFPFNGDTAVVYSIQYELSTDEFTVPEMTIASNGIFNFNYVVGENDYMRITSIAVDDVTLGMATIDADGLDFLLDDFATFPVGRKQFMVTNYVVDYRPNVDMGFGGFTSLWNEFDLVLLGDVNCDGSVNLLDVGPFVDALTNDFPDAKADINQDGSDDLMDVAGFVALLGAGG